MGGEREGGSREGARGDPVMRRGGGGREGGVQSAMNNPYVLFTSHEIESKGNRVIVENCM